MFSEIINANANTLLEKAIEFKKNEDYTNYFIHLTMACNLQNDKAIKMFKEDCLEIYGKQDFSITRHFYQESLNFPYSVNNMGYLYEHGLGVVQNLKKAVELYQIGVGMKCDISMHNLAFCFREGNGVKQNIDKAIELYELAASLGNSSSMNSLGFTYENKLRNYDMAIKYYEMAANRNFEMGLQNLIALYQKSEVKRDKKYVVNYFLTVGKEKALTQIYNYDKEDLGMLKERFELEKENEKMKIENREMRNHILASPDGPLYFEALKQWKKDRI